MQNIADLLQEFLTTDIRFHPVYLLPFLMIALLLYWVQGKSQKGFWAWLFPKEIYFHPSHFVDLKLFIVGRLLGVFKFFNVTFVQAAFALIGMGLVSAVTGLDLSAQELTWVRVFLATIIITLTSDFCVYWVHRIHHEAPIIWPFHAAHHSAEIMTPVTVYRKHPVYDFISSFVKAVLLGLVQGGILVLLMGQVHVGLIAGINAFYFIFNFFGSNFRHSHIWFSYGRMLEHVVISPAQHQIHHSLEPRHHNKNYGEILAIWDWMFGTLYIPEEQEDLAYGISKSSTSNERIEQPHLTLKDALIVPFKQSWKTIKRRQREKKTS